MDTYTCCICGKEHEGFGNNPNGAIDETKKLITWGEKALNENCKYH
jgi:hypothetical protein